jgi:hypothetical protein
LVDKPKDVSKDEQATAKKNGTLVKGTNAFYVMEWMKDIIKTTVDDWFHSNEKAIATIDKTDLKGQDFMQVIVNQITEKILK